MRAIQCDVYGEPEGLILRDMPPPTPEAGEALVAVEAVGLGFVDALTVRGAYQVKRPLPFVPGSEMAGRVIGVGTGVDAALVGKPIVALSPSGALAERVALPASACTIVPDAIDPAIAAGMLVDYCTALYGLDDCGRLGRGETVLVLGASGGVGDAALDVAKAMGARTIAVASSLAKLLACAHRAPALSIDYGRPDWRKTLETANAGHSIDAVWDPVGGPYSETAFRCLSPGGRHLVVGFAAGDIPRLPLNLALLKRASLVGVDWGGHVRADPALNANAPLLSRLLAWVAEGRIAPRVHVAGGLDATALALRALLDRKSIGKPVIRVGG